MALLWLSGDGKGYNAGVRAEFGLIDRRSSFISQNYFASFSNQDNEAI
jgi:hypothetical protein